MSQTDDVRQEDDDPFDLERFTKAQDGYPGYEEALEEISRGRKQSHWIWYIFPQIAGLGYSSNSRYYAISSLDEARAYLAHPVLGTRLRECAEAVLGVEGRSASAIFGSPDDMKLRSSMTLFAAASNPGSIYSQVLEKYFGGRPDSETVRRLQTGRGS